MDMHLPAFRDGAFDAITAFNALHHTHRLEALIGTLAAALRPGGRLCVVEPYWFLEAVRQAFGAAQIEAGINENVYRLEEWHRWFVQAGPRARDLHDHALVQRGLRQERRRRSGRARSRSRRPKPSCSTRLYDASLFVAPREIARRGAGRRDASICR